MELWALVGAASAAGYGFLTGVGVRDPLQGGRHRRYDDERVRQLPSYRLLPVWCALAAAALGWRTAGSGGGPAALVLPALLVLPVPLYAALWAVDLDVHRLPRALTLPAYPLVAALTGVAAWSMGDLAAWRRALLAGAATWLFFAALHLLSRRQLGRGDVTLAAPLGMATGLFGWERAAGGVYAMFVVGGLWALWSMWRRRAGRRTRIAFGPAMIAGTWVVLVWGGAGVP